jgi:hypothetical protein
VRGWLRDRLGRFAAGREERQPIENAPELSPASRQAIEWLARDPELARRLGPLVETSNDFKLAASDFETGRGDRPVSAVIRSDQKRNSEPDVLRELTAKVADLTRRADSLVVRDEALVKLHAEGWTEEGLGELTRYMATHGLSDARQAARQFEREAPAPEPVVSSRGNGHWLMDEPRRAEQADAYKALMAGDDEQFLQLSIAAALREVRGQ